MKDNDYAQGLAEIIRLEEDQVRALMLHVSPELRHDNRVMTDLLRELVKIERTKHGLDAHFGRLTLSVNKEKTSENKQPDLIGTGRVAGHEYKVAAWIHKNDTLEVVLSESKHHMT